MARLDIKLYVEIAFIYGIADGVFTDTNNHVKLLLQLAKLVTVPTFFHIFIINNNTL